MAEVTSSSLVGSTLFFSCFAGKTRSQAESSGSSPRLCAATRGACKSTYFYKGYRRPYNSTHSPNVTPPIHNPAPIRILVHRDKLAQTPFARRAGLLSITSAQSKKRATIRSSLARMTSPRRKVPKPGPGKSPKTMLVIAIASPTTMKRTFRKSNRPRLELCWRLLRR
jgi:hypothetical protein